VPCNRHCCRQSVAPGVCGGIFLRGPLNELGGHHYLPSGVDVNDPRLSPLRAPDLFRAAASTTAECQDAREYLTGTEVQKCAGRADGLLGRGKDAGTASMQPRHFEKVLPLGIRALTQCQADRPQRLSTSIWNVGYTPRCLNISPKLRTRSSGRSRLGPAKRCGTALFGKCFLFSIPGQIQS
jgi:hypothetical protein